MTITFSRRAARILGPLIIAIETWRRWNQFGDIHSWPAIADDYIAGAFLFYSATAAKPATEFRGRLYLAAAWGVGTGMFRPLFDKREWVFRVETTLEYSDLDDPRAKDGFAHETKTDSATCRVIRVVRWAKSIGSRIECSGPLSGARVEGLVPVAGRFLDGDWVATPRGLWHLRAPGVDGPEPVVAPGDMRSPVGWRR